MRPQAINKKYADKKYQQTHAVDNKTRPGYHQRGDNAAHAGQQNPYRHQVLPEINKKTGKTHQKYHSRNGQVNHKPHHKGFIKENACKQKIDVLK